MRQLIVALLQASLLTALHIQGEARDRGAGTLMTVSGRSLGPVSMVDGSGSSAARGAPAVLPCVGATTNNGRVMDGIYFFVPDVEGRRYEPQPWTRPGFFSDATPNVLPDGETMTGDIIAQDVTGDGLEDITFTQYSPVCDSNASLGIRVWIQKPNGRFVDESNLRIPTLHAPSTTIAVSDVDADGDQDILASGYSCGERFLSGVLLINDGSGHFIDESESRLPPFPIHPHPAFLYDLTVGPIDDDAFPDVVAIVFGPFDSKAVEAPTHPEIWLNDGSGSFVRDSVGRLPSGKNRGYLKPTLVNLDTDSPRDLLISTFVIDGLLEAPTHLDSIDSGVAFFRNLGDGYYVDETSGRIPARANFFIKQSPTVDVDNDGDQDILEVGALVGEANELMRFLINDGSTVFSALEGAFPDKIFGVFSDAEFADLNRDNCPDVFITRVQLDSSDRDLLLFGDCTGRFRDSSGILPDVLDFSVSASIFDFQGDGDPDISVGNSGSDGVSGGQNRLSQNEFVMTTGLPATPPSRADLPDLYVDSSTPARPLAEIRFSLDYAAEVSLAIYNILGERVTLFEEGELQKGEHTARWDTRSVPTGVYFCELRVIPRSVVGPPPLRGWEKFAVIR